MCRTNFSGHSYKSEHISTPKIVICMNFHICGGLTFRSMESNWNLETATMTLRLHKKITFRD